MTDFDPATQIAAGWEYIDRTYGPDADPLEGPIHELGRRWSPKEWTDWMKGIRDRKLQEPPTISGLVDLLTKPLFVWRMAHGRVGCSDPMQDRSARTRLQNAEKAIDEVARWYMQGYLVHLEADHAVLKRVWEVHVRAKNGALEMCMHDGFEWPCPTIQAFDDPSIPT